MIRRLILIALLFAPGRKVGKKAIHFFAKSLPYHFFFLERHTADFAPAGLYFFYFGDRRFDFSERVFNDGRYFGDQGLFAVQVCVLLVVYFFVMFTAGLKERVADLAKRCHSLLECRSGTAPMVFHSS